MHLRYKPIFAGTQFSDLFPRFDGVLIRFNNYIKVYKQI